MKVEGKIKLINDTQTFDSGFQKREFVVTTAEQYPQDIKMELIKDKCGLIDTYNVGDEVSVDINLRGNEYNGKYYVNLQAWRISANAEDGVANIAKEAVANAQPSTIDDVGEDDLPF